MKTCTRCGDDKGEFYKDSTTKDGLSACCKRCKDKYRTTETGRRSVAKYHKRYYSSPNGRAMKMWSSLGTRGRSACYEGIEVRMTREEFMGWAVPAIEAFLKRSPDEVPSLDRIDPDGHYELSNLRIVSKRFNILRSRYIPNKLGISRDSPLEAVYDGVALVVEAMLDCTGKEQDGFLTHLRRRWRAS